VLGSKETRFDEKDLEMSSSNRFNGEFEELQMPTSTSFDLGSFAQEINVANISFSAIDFMKSISSKMINLTKKSNE